MRRRDYWTVDDVRQRFDDLLKAADLIGPQEIIHGGRTYLLCAKDSDKAASAKDYLTQGGPLSDADVKDAFE